jgi:hypothetical protein
MIPDPQARFTKSNKGSSVKPIKNGHYIGKVSRTSGGIYVKIPKIAPGITFGPCKKFFAESLAVGDNVLCTFIDNKFDEVVLVGKQA